MLVKYKTNWFDLGRNNMLAFNVSDSGFAYFKICLFKSSEAITMELNSNKLIKSNVASINVIYKWYDRLVAHNIIVKS